MSKESWHWVHSFHITLLEKHVKDYLLYYGVEELQIEGLQSRQSTNFDSFKITILKKESQKVMNENFWLDVIKLREYREARIAKIYYIRIAVQN